ncbi:type II toxin-antitoxin system RelE family toxin [Desulfatitalea alkaliphila]|uniref:Type II toxin-antitoxin system RelE/ParE family toxin n=1 Tax=Desulfatitalea alkaliphila TaxID=2929485 RepID=A0AA41R183_9BACT|nr:type II toxin-antitoxin system RelE/ParE family toxin [Desulfatitalea alkaliphila]MCJ8499746.1 type II toxin-antitoxin system RelE/ParE family toxin [Desulfatitalea alkaliphila]
MPGYEIFFKESVWKELRKIPKSDLKKVLARVEQLGNDPRPMGCEKLTALELYRIRQGNYRIVYSIQDNALTIWVVKVGNRKDVYR